MMFTKTMHGDAATTDRPDPLRAWCRTHSLEGRLAAIEALAGRRLPSFDAAELWLHLVGKAAGMATPEQTQSMLRQFLVLAPEHPRAAEIYDLLMNRQEPLHRAPGLVFMVTSCVRYLPQAQRTLDALQARGAEAVVVIGDPDAEVPVQDGSLVVLPVDDTYEALTSKVLEGLTFLRQRHGREVAVAKVDDDVDFNPRFDVDRLAHQARLHDYVGQQGGRFDSCWHIGKTSRPVPVYSRRRQASFARGALYLLGPRAVEHLVREWVHYPGEFAGEIYEDRAVAAALARAQIQVTPASFESLGGNPDLGARLMPAAH